MVEHDLAKVGVAGSSPVFRSENFHLPLVDGFFFMCHSGGGTGRHAGLKILFAVRRVWVQLPSRVLVIITKALIVLTFKAFLFLREAQREALVIFPENF